LHDEVDSLLFFDGLKHAIFKSRPTGGCTQF